MMKYLPVHKSMLKVLKKGMTVVHNGGSGYQGLKGNIYHIGREKITVRYAEPRHGNEKQTLEYSIKWFLENFYIYSADIRKMKGRFNGSSYLEKYSEYKAGNALLKKEQQIKHEAMKLIVDAKYAPVIDDPRDPLDEVGDFVLVSRGERLAGVHKTQRIAEMAAAKHTRENKCCVGIFKLVAQSDVVVDSKITRK